MIIAAVATISIAFHGCTSPTHTNNPITLRMAVSNDEIASWTPLKNQFQAKHPNIRIDLDGAIGSDNLKQKYIESFAGDTINLENANHYDIVYTDIIWLPEFVEQGWLKDLTDYFPNIEEENFLESELRNGRYDTRDGNGERLYRIPFRTDAGILYYRQDVLEQLDESPPETFDDLLRISQKAREGGAHQGYYWQGSQDEAISAMFLEVLKGHGGFWIDSEILEDDSTSTEDAIGLNRDEAIQAINFLRSTLQSGISSGSLLRYREEDTRTQFRRGNAVFMRNWPAAWAAIHTPGSAIIGRVNVQPMVRSENGRSASSIGGWGFAVAENASYPEQAIEAIRFFMSRSAQWQFTLSYGSVPSRESLFYDPTIVRKYNHYPRLFEIIRDYSVPRPMIPQYGEASCILQDALHEVLENPDTANVRAIMNDAALATRELLENNRGDCLARRRE